MTDEELLVRSLEEPEAFGHLFDRYFDEIARFCLRRTGAVEGEDLAGDVFRWAFEHRQRFDPARGSVRAWLFRVAYNRVRHAWRGKDRRGVAYLRLALGSDGGGPDLSLRVIDAIDAERDLRAVAAVLERQPFDDVETLLLYAWEELSYSEIADVLGVPIGTVRSRINRIRHRLRDVLDAGPAASTYSIENQEACNE